MMQQGTTILQYLTFRPNVSFNDPATPHGKLWNAALKHVTQTQGWGELDWGARVASEQVVDLLISKINTYFAIPTSYGKVSSVQANMLIPNSRLGKPHGSIAFHDPRVPGIFEYLQCLTLTRNFYSKPTNSPITSRDAKP